MGTQGGVNAAVEDNGSLGDDANMIRYLPAACRP
jgi:hypothetical protein